MDTWDWAGFVVGLAVVSLALGDMWITIFHKDFEGPLAKAVQHSTWRLTIAIARRTRRGRRLLVSMAGPVMVLFTLAAWLSLYVLGFTIVVWPQIREAFLTDPGIDPSRMGFVDALYYSGVTGTTLGFGDISPATSLFKILAFVQSALGFGMFTATITYLLSIISGSAERNALAVRVISQTGGSGDGVELVAAGLGIEDDADLRRRLDALTEAVHTVQEVFHQLPVLDLYFRSREPDHDPEPMLRSLAEAALAAHLLASDRSHRTLKRSAQELDNAISQVMLVVGRQYFPRRVHAQLVHPEPAAEDRVFLDELRRRLLDASPGLVLESSGGSPELALACRLRVFMRALDSLTAWSVIQPSRYRQRDDTATVEADDD